MSGAAYFGVAQRIFLAIILSWALTVSIRGLEPAKEAVEAPAGRWVDDAA